MFLIGSDSSGAGAPRFGTMFAAATAPVRTASAERYQERTVWMTYLLLSDEGLVYLGATSNLRARLRSHSNRFNTAQYTSGHRWRLLAAVSSATRNEAFMSVHSSACRTGRLFGNCSTLSGPPGSLNVTATSSTRTNGLIATIQATLRRPAATHTLSLWKAPSPAPALDDPYATRMRSIREKLTCSIRTGRQR
jgi:predicted GIY-YIG superfamily endonuclease